MAYFPLNSQQNIPSQEIQRNFVRGELSVWDYFIWDWLQGGSWRALFCFPVWIISSVRDIRADVWSGRLVLFSPDAGCPRRSHENQYKASAKLRLSETSCVFLFLARDGRLEGRKLSTAAGSDRLYSWLTLTPDDSPLISSIECPRSTESYWVLQVCFLQVLSTDDRRLVEGRKASLEIHFILFLFSSHVR